MGMVLKWLNTVIISLFLVSLLWSQEDVNISRKHFKTGIDIGFDEAWKSIKEGDKQYKAGKGTYDIARDHYLFAQQYNSENSQLNYKLGVCFLFTDHKYKAIDYLQKAYTLNPDVSKDIHLLLGHAYQLVLEFDLAVQHYNMHLETLKPEDLEAFSGLIAKRLEECEHGRQLSMDPVRVILKNLGSEVNSKYDDYNPVFAFDDTALFITSRRPFEKSKRNEIDNKFNEDIYRSALINHKFSQAVRLGKPFNSPNNDALVRISQDGSRMLIYRGHIEGGDLQVSIYNPEKKRWSKPKGVRRNLASKEGETSAALSQDNAELFFISGNEKLSLGGKDILTSRLDEKGKWSDPVNAGSTLNTPYDEEGVFISADGRHLYFASQGHNSMGGFDIFRSTRLPDGFWSEPENLGYPINTPDDEVFYVTDQAGTYGYYSTTRPGGSGSRDIYKVIYLGSEKELVFRTKEQLVAGPGMRGTGFLTLPLPVILDTAFVLNGFVMDTLGEVKPLASMITFIDPVAGRQELSVISDSITGAFTARLPEPKVYGVEIHASGYLYFLDILDLSSENNDQIVNRDFFLQKVEVGTKVVLDNIYFETGKAILRPESNDQLDQVYRFLANNPSVKLEISGHTDNTGSLRTNQKLSGDRAKAVVNFLVGKGIPQEMLLSQGYADSQPVASNDTSEGRKQNRRVEFKVLSK